MIGRLAFLVCFTIISGNPEADHGKSSRIIGGIEAVPNAWPHQVALFIDGVSICGGTLISTEWILTAAHCMDQAVSVDAVMGAHNIYENETTQVKLTSKQFVVHGNWNYNKLTNDVALIKLPSPVEVNENIAVAKLPTIDPPEGTVVTAIGWGRTSDSVGGISYVLRQVDVPILSTSDCNSDYGIINGNHICTNSSGGMGTCYGDAGSPLNYDGFVIGVTSFNSSPECEAGYADVFARVTSYLDWIEFYTGIKP